MDHLVCSSGKVQDKIPNTEVLHRCAISAIEAFIIKHSFDGLDMSTECPMPGSRRLSSTLTNIQSTGIDSQTWKDLAGDR